MRPKPPSSGQGHKLVPGKGTFLSESTDVFVTTPNRLTFFFPETESLNFGHFKAAFSVNKIETFSFGEEKCLSVWNYDKNISTF